MKNVCEKSKRNCVDTVLVLGLNKILNNKINKIIHRIMLNSKINKIIFNELE